MSDILQERQSSYLKLTINRPEASNALSLDLFDKLSEILSENRNDPDLKSVGLSLDREIKASQLVEISKN